MIVQYHNKGIEMLELPKILNSINRRSQHVLRPGKHLEYLQELQRKYVLVPADKAADNVVIVCKRYYLQVVLKELTTTCTYHHKAKDCMHVVNEHMKFIMINKIEIEPDLQHLPSFYWLPKLHEQPCGTRFTAASNRCSTKLLSKLLATCLGKVVSHFRQYCSSIYSRTGVNCFWIIDNSQQVLSALNNVNYFSTAKHFDSYDFSTYIQAFHMHLLKMHLMLSLRKHTK